MIKNCKTCDSELLYESDYCPSCGTIFIDHLNCTHHADEDAEAVCVICQKAFCNECGNDVNGRFFCANHMSVGVTLSARRSIKNYSSAEVKVIGDQDNEQSIFLSD